MIKATQYLVSKTLILALSSAALPAFAATIENPNLSAWLSTATGTSNNVKADTNGGAGWQFTGTGGVAYDFGNLAPTGWGSFQGNTYEFVINIAQGGVNQAFASAVGWGGIEVGAYGYWNYSGGQFSNKKNTEGWTDIAPVNVRYNYGETALLSFVMRETTAAERTANPGIKNNLIDFYFNGAFVGTGWKDDRWNQGGVGYLGSLNDGTSDPLSDGSKIYGVSTYARALTATEITANYAALTSIPEPSTYALVGGAVALLGAVVLRRRKK